MNEEIIEARTNQIVSINDTGKKFEIVGTVDNWEDFFLDQNNFIPILEFVKVRVENLVADPTTKDGVQNRKTLKTKIGGIIKAIDAKHDEIVKILKDKPKKIDAVRKAVKDTLLLRQADIMKPVEEIEARKNEIIEISNLPASAIGCDSYGIQDVLNVLETHAHDEKYWQESYTEAVATLNESRRQLNAMLETALKQEEQQREYERLKAEEAERNRKAAEEAAKAKAEAEEAKRKAEEAELARIAAEEAQKRAEAEALKAKAEAENAKATANVVQNGNAAQVIKDSQQTMSKMLFPDDKAMYRKMCKTEAKEDLMKCDLTEDQARKIVIAILSGNVRHVAMMF